MGDAPDRDQEQNGEGRERDGHHADGAVSNRDGAAQVPECGDDDDGEFEQQSAVAVVELGEDAGEVERDGGGIDGHVEDTGGQRQPGDLEAPEPAEGAMSPDIEAAFVRDGRGEFADHERCRQAPEDRDEGEQKQRAVETGHADDVLKTVRAARDHEIDGRDERKETEAGGFGLAGVEDRRDLLRRMADVQVNMRVAGTRVPEGQRLRWCRQIFIFFATQTIVSRCKVLTH